MASSFQNSSADAQSPPVKISCHDRQVSKLEEPLTLEKNVCKQSATSALSKEALNPQFPWYHKARQLQAISYH